MVGSCETSHHYCLIPVYARRGFDGYVTLLFPVFHPPLNIGNIAARRRSGGFHFCIFIEVVGINRFLVIPPGTIVVRNPLLRCVWATLPVPPAIVEVVPVQLASVGQFVIQDQFSVINAVAVFCIGMIPARVCIIGSVAIIMIHSLVVGRSHIGFVPHIPGPIAGV